MVEYSGTNSSVPVDAYACAAVTAGTAPQTVTSGSLAPTHVNDIPILEVSQSNTTTAPSAGSSSGGSSGACVLRAAGNTGAYYLAGESCPAATGTSNTSESITYPSVPVNGYLTAALLVAAPSAPSTTAPYVGVYEYYGPQFGNNYCNGALCTSNADVATMFKYVEGYNKIDGTNNAATACPSGSASSGGCLAFFYNNEATMNCDTNGNDSIESALATADAGGPVETSFLHAASPPSGSNRLYASGSCTAITPQSGAVRYSFNVGDTSTNGINAQFGTYWFSLASGINGQTWIGTRWDDWGYNLPYGCNACYQSATEYPVTAAGVASWRQALTTIVNQYASYPMAANALGSGGAHYTPSDDYSGGPEHAGIIGYEVDVDDICNNLTGHNLKALIFERIATKQVNGTLEGMGYENTGIAANTASEVWNNPRCSGIDLVDLEETSNNGTDVRAARDYALALRMLLEPTGYGGTKAEQQLVPWRYQECAPTTICGSTNPNNTNLYGTNTLFPEDGLVFVPDQNDPLPAWNKTGATGSNGCQGGSGGIVSLTESCGIGVGTDWNGAKAGIYYRYGECYKFGGDWGKCEVLVNDTKSAITISSTSNNTLCHYQGCSSYPDVWSYAGSGAEQYYKDTSFAICGSSTTICNGAWGEQPATFPYTLGACEQDIVSTWSTDCSVVFLSK